MTHYPASFKSGPFIGWGSLKGNHHGPKIDGERTVLKSTWQIIQLGADGMMPPPRYSWGLRLWIYAADGRCWNFDIGWRSTRRKLLSEAEADRRGKLWVEQQKALGKWPPSRDNGGDYLAAMYHAHGMGLTAEPPK